MGRQALATLLLGNRDMRLSRLGLLGFILAMNALCHPMKLLAQMHPDKDREKIGIRQQFTKHFHDLQVNSQRLLSDCNAGTLTKGQLAKEAKAIHKSAKLLQTLIALGDLVEDHSLPKVNLNGADEFAQSIQSLANVVYSFSHSPYHQNHRIFDMAEATKVQKELIAIIHLSKTLEIQSRHYTNPPHEK
jgi:hypothetical protein